VFAKKMGRMVYENSGRLLMVFFFFFFL